MTKASARARVLQHVSFWRERGLPVETAMVQGRGRNGFLRVLLKALHADTLVVQRKLFKPWKLSLLRRLVRRLVFDFDDALFDLSDARRERAGAGMDAELAQRRQRLQHTLRLADVAIAGNEYLASYARGFCRQVEVVPTAVPVPAELPRRPLHETITVGWIGAASTVHYLEPLAPVLQELCRRHASLRFVIVADKFPDLGLGDRQENRHWSLEREAADLDSFDIGIMPLHDDYGRGKCAFKLLQYFSRGIAAVASPVGMNLEVIEDGRNGYLAATAQEWMDRLQMLIEDAALRQRLGEAGYALARERYSTEVVGQRLLVLLQTTTSQTARATSSEWLSDMLSSAADES